tara:strand:+ start:4926 stop:5075 length:150 start_codon:yes stop_codon:yes gene_type:complete
LRNGEKSPRKTGIGKTSTEKNRVKIVKEMKKESRVRRPTEMFHKKMKIV